MNSNLGEDCEEKPRQSRSFTTAVDNLYREKRETVKVISFISSTSTASSAAAVAAAAVSL